MDKKLLRNIIIAVAAIAILGGGYYAATKWEPEAENETESSTSAPETIIFEMDEENFKSLDITNEGGSYTIIKSGDSYTISGFENSELNTGSIAGAVTNLKKLTAKKLIGDSGSENEKFGLLSPSATIVLKLNDGSEKKLIIGDETPTKDGYYVLADGKIYLVSTYYADYYLKTPDDYKNLSIATIDTANLKTFEIYKGGEKVTSIRTINDSDTLSNSVNETFVMDCPFYEFAASDRLMKLLENIGTISAVKVVEDSTENASKYGIGAYTLKLDDGKAVHELKFGSSDNDGNVYAIYSGRNAIFTIDKAIAAIAEDFRPLEYIYKFIHIYSIDNVSDVTLNAAGGEYKLHIDTIDEETKKYKINSSEIEEDKFKKVYQEIIGIMFTDTADLSKLGSKVGEVTFTFTDGKTDTSEYFEYDERNYAVKKSDGKCLILLKKNLDNVPSQIEKDINSNE